MSPKRAREADQAHPIPASKRPKIDPALARIWEALADDDENVRLEGAYELLQNHCQLNNLEHAQRIAKRLFRGLCSGRKSARLGFYVALVGALSIKPHRFGSSDLHLSEIVSIWEAQTAPDSETSGQDERDHYFGRLFGVKALVDSGSLLVEGKVQASEWNEILDDVYTLMAQKPWLRSEAGLVVCSAIRLFSSQKGNRNEQAVLQSLKQLKEHKLVRTVDGVAIWLTAQEYLASGKLPQDTWASGDPLNVTAIETLKKVMLDIPALEEDNAAGKTVWSTTLNSAWPLVIKRLSTSPTGSEVTFRDFWRNVVDHGLFNPSSTAERKLVGFLVLDTALKEVPYASIPVCFSQNLMSCLIQSLKAEEESHLRKIVSKVFTDMKSYSKDYQSEHINQVIKGLLIGSDLADFDALTKTKIVQFLFDLTEIKCEDGVFKEMLSWLRQPPVSDNDPVKVSRRRKSLLNVLQRSMCQSIRTADRVDHRGAEERASRFEEYSKIIKALLNLKNGGRKASTSGVPFDDSTVSFIQEKIYLILEALLAAGVEGRLVFFDAVRSLEKLELEAEAAIMEHVIISWRMFKTCLKASEQRSDTLITNHNHQKLHNSGLMQGPAILLGLLLLQVYDGDEDSTEMLEEVNSMVSDILEGENEVKVADHAVEIVLSLVSKSSRFLRRAGGLAFEAFAPFVTSEGLEALQNVLLTKESRSGQDELFENGDGETEGSFHEASASEDDELGSDVEIVNQAGDDDSVKDDSAFSSSDEGDSSKVGSDASNSGRDEETSDAEDVALASFEGALAAALGTRKLNSEDLEHGFGSSESESDSDMSDSQMMELDEKLAEVFKHQQSELSSQKIRKEEMKSARENVVNLKNRALDLLNSFLHLQQARALECINILATLLKLTKSTDTQQLAHRALDIIKGYVQKSKGAKLPTVTQDSKARARLIETLREVQSLAMEKDASNAIIDVASRLHILICKLLVNAGEKNIQKVVKQGQSNNELTLESRKSLQEFWKQYNTWVATIQTKNARTSTKNSINSDNSKSSKHDPEVEPHSHKKKRNRKL